MECDLYTYIVRNKTHARDTTGKIVFVCFALLSRYNQSLPFMPVFRTCGLSLISRVVTIAFECANNRCIWQSEQSDGCLCCSLQS